MNIIKTLVVDDEKISIKVFEQLLSQFKEIEIIASVQNVDDAVEAIYEHQPDIVFLDVQMPKKNGFDLLAEIKNFEFQPTIIFVTAHDEYAIKAIRHSAFDYLLKPVKLIDLQESFKRYLEDRKNFTDKQNINSLIKFLLLRKIQFKTRTNSIFVNPNDIIYIEADGNYAKLFLRNNKYYLISSYLSEVHEKLPVNSFFRINRSIVINMDYLEQIDRKKRICRSECENKEYQFKISASHIRKLEEINN
jgi:two-component system LytT family response regulator